jgi:hypothetical protein
MLTLNVIKFDIIQKSVRLITCEIILEEKNNKKIYLLAA